MKIFRFMFLLIGVSLLGCFNKPKPPQNYCSKTVDIVTPDGLTMKADLYLVKDSSAPFILLFHQADFSRGEYIEIAPRLNKLGFNCIAVDQRSGKK